MKEQIRDEGLDCAYLLGKHDGYKQGKLDGLAESLSTKGVQFYVDEIKKVGAREFAEWLCRRNYFDGWYKFDGIEEVKLTTDEILEEWQKGTL